MTVKIPRPDLAMVGLCALSVIAIVVCKLLHVEPPPVLDFVATTSLGGGAGIATQRAVSSLPSQPSSPAAAPAPRPAPVPLNAEPATGVFRAATHAP